MQKPITWMGFLGFDGVAEWISALLASWIISVRVRSPSLYTCSDFTLELAVLDPCTLPFVFAGLPLGTGSATVTTIFSSSWTERAMRASLQPSKQSFKKLLNREDQSLRDHKFLLLQCA
jgi:hypothetical protein